MILSPEASVTLLQALMTVTTVAAILWLGIGIPMGIKSPTAWRLAFGNLALSAGAYFAATPDDSSDLHIYRLAVACFVWGSIAMRSGVSRLMNASDMSAREVVILLAITGIALVWLTPSPLVHTGFHGFAFVISCLLAWSYARAGQDILNGIKQYFNWRGGLLVSAPFLVLASIFSLRAMLCLGDDNLVAPLLIGRVSDSPLLALSVMILALAANVSMFSITIAHLLARINHLADHDGLTNTLNRRAMDERIRNEQLRCTRSGEHYSLVIIDLDYFKSINERFGHEGGDSALKQAARSMMAVLRNTECMGRFGGEEFTVLLPLMNLEEAAQRAEQMRLALLNARIVFDSETIPITASFGVSTLRSDYDSPETLMQRADRAMYRAKATGRNRVETDKDMPLRGDSMVWEG